MSRLVKQDYEYDYQKFIKLLEKAIGSQSRAAYARQCCVSNSLISQAFNNKLPSTPIPFTLKKLADGSEGRVSYEEFLAVCGYDTSKYASKTKKYENESFITAAIIDGLTKSNLTWTLQNCENNSDFKVTLVNAPVTHWYFEFVTTLPASTIKNEYMHSYFYKLMFQKRSIVDGVKYSYVTSNEQIYDKFINCSRPWGLRDYVSIILIDVKKGRIIKETYLNEASNDVQKINLSKKS